MLLSGPSPFGRFFGNADNHSEALGELPAWVRTHRGVGLGALKAHGVIGHRTQIHSPNLNAHVERLQQTLQVECLVEFPVLGTKHLDHLVREYLDHYNTERPHSGIGFSVPAKSGAPPRLRLALDRPGPVGRVRCHERLSGVLKHYSRVAA